MNLTTLSNTELYSLAHRYGKRALFWRQKFIGLLPEVNRRRLYEKKFGSIFEFAYKLAGLSEEQVRRTLNLEQRFQDKPTLHSLLVSGEVSVNKLARVASIATPQNEEEWAGKVQVLSKHAVETLVRDEKLNGLSKPQIEVKSVPGNTLNLDPEVQERLQNLQDKGINLNQLLTEFLDQREQSIEEEKQEISATLPETTFRYIPVKIRRLLQREYGDKCSISTCSRPAKHLHHTQTFSLSRRHNPRYLAPLCKAHHEIAHGINLKVQEKRLILCT